MKPKVSSRAVKMFDRAVVQKRRVKNPETLLRARNAVFDIGNVAELLSESWTLGGVDPFHHPTGPPFDHYWFEFPFVRKSEFWPGMIGVLCEVVERSDNCQVVDCSFYAEYHKKVDGPQMVWRVWFPSDAAPSYSVIKPPDPDAVTRAHRGSHQDNLSPSRDKPRVPAREEYAHLLNDPDALKAAIAELDAEAETLQKQADELSENALMLSRLVVIVEAYMVLRVLLVAHAFLACKNVTVESRHPAARKPSKKVRRRADGDVYTEVTYKVLVVKPAGRQSGASPDGGGIDHALHIVRGHFKTFTEDRPLFGKAVGTYWWSPTIRGNKDKGVIVKDYQLNPSRP